MFDKELELLKQQHIITQNALTNVYKAYIKGLIEEKDIPTKVKDLVALVNTTSLKAYTDFSKDIKKAKEELKLITSRTMADEALKKVS